MYYREHSPPHFHAEYGEHEALIAIVTLDTYSGKLPRRVHNLVLEWADIHREELMADWIAARQNRPLAKIEPLT